MDMVKALSTLLVTLLLVGTLATGQVKVGGSAKIGGTAKVATQVGGGEVDFVTDTFTEASDISLTSHTGELGATWTQHTSYPAAPNLDADNDQIYPAGDPSAAHASGVPPSADYCVEGVVKVESIVSANAAITWRVDTAANTKMIFQLNNGTGWRMRKIVAGTQTTIGAEDTTTNIPSVGETRTMRACSVGDAHTAYINGVLLGTVGGTDASVTAAGRAGVRFSGPIAETTGYHFQSFRAFTP